MHGQYKNYPVKNNWVLVGVWSKVEKLCVMWNKLDNLLLEQNTFAHFIGEKKHCTESSNTGNSVIKNMYSSTVTSLTNRGHFFWCTSKWHLEVQYLKKIGVENCVNCQAPSNFVFLVIKHFYTGGQKPKNIKIHFLPNRGRH